MKADTYRLTAVEALRAFEIGSLTVEEYARSLLNRIEERDHTVKAWAYLNPSEVLEQAKALDKVPKDQRGPLHGVAVGIKDVIYTKGMPTQHNSPIYTNSQPEIDAASVATLRQAGALILGKTTTTQFAAITVGTKTSNAHDPERTPGGSSSGSGAAVADFQVPLALGTQTGGSMIRPGSFNGIFALKPTWNAISREGQKIYSLILDTLGFYGRSVDDLKLLADVFGIKDDEPPSPLDNGVRGLTFAFLKTMVWKHAGPGTRNAWEQGRDLLRKAGAEVVDIDFPSEFDKLPEWHTCVLFKDGSVAFRPEYKVAKDQLDSSLVDFVEEKHGFSRKDYTQAFDGISALRPKWDAIAEQYAAVVVPSVPDEAPKGLESTGSAVFQGIWTALHAPIVNIPGFKGENALPVGLSLTTARFKDQALLSVAKEVGEVWIRQS
ncbi:glutamyl-tRNA(Gln) amidotransferase subunit A like protein [Zymoseptoria brevis]|uniref:Glutamyl-tRNA(Gln) amidotransferase subunit A like protein n=1 Tax=Zymoseptoria brevis TaxID=1047168 RepID=A0A0F4G626_9PEZI|nr:glutamyl-tRNA(Gln) amidotransferase subunit A like protein [Zymoseptoria brevis]